MKNLPLSLLTLAAALLMLSACAQNAKYAKLEPYDFTTLTCSGFLSWHDCRTQALTICPSGYYVADYLENYTIQRREISIACKV